MIDDIHYDRCPICFVEASPENIAICPNVKCVKNAKPVISMVEKTDDSRHWSAIDCLEEAIEDIKKGDRNNKKVLVLHLDTDNESFKVNFIQAGLSMSQCLALCDVAKAMCLEEMGYGIIEGSE